MSPSYGQCPHHHHQLVRTGRPFLSPEGDCLKNCLDASGTSSTEHRPQLHPSPPDVTPSLQSKCHGYQCLESLPGRKELLPLKLPLLYLQTAELFHEEPPLRRNSHLSHSQPSKDQSDYHYTHRVRSWKIRKRIGGKRKEIC